MLRSGKPWGQSHGDNRPERGKKVASKRKSGWTSSCLDLTEEVHRCIHRWKGMMHLTICILHFSEVVCISCKVVYNSLRPNGLWLTGLLCPWDFPGKNSGVGCHVLLQGIFVTQGLNPGLLQADSLPSEPPGKPQGYVGKNF